MLRTDIGEGESALQCTTDSTTCCTNNPPEMRGGEFYMPDGDIVLVEGSTTNGYYRTRGSRHILLHRRSTGTITGWFRCNIPQANGPTADLYINIGEYITVLTLGACTKGLVQYVVSVCSYSVCYHSSCYIFQAENILQYHRPFCGVC